MENLYCDILRIAVPRVDDVVGHREAKPFALLLAALLERGEPMTLEQVAARLAKAGAGKAPSVLAALQRCRPGRPPVYRDGDHYGLDPYDDELDLWVFTLGLRPSAVPAISIVRDPPPAPASETTPLTVEELRLGWTHEYLANWTAQRVALAVLDACGPLLPQQVVARATQLNPGHRLAADSRLGRHGAVVVAADGRWSAQPGHPALLGARKAVRARMVAHQASERRGADPSVLRAYQQAAERRREAHARRLASLRRVILHSYPPASPQMVVLLDAEARHLEVHAADALPAVRARLATYDVIVGLGVRAALDGLGIAHAALRVAELHPFQKTRQVSAVGDVVKVTPELLIRHTCRIPHPLGASDKLRAYVQGERWGVLGRRLEADAKALHAFYQYGRTHGHVRLRWGYVDEFLPVPWVHRDEALITDLLRSAEGSGAVLDVVAGPAPSWDDPWARAKRCHVHATGPYGYVLVSEDGRDVIDPDDVQMLRSVAQRWG